MFILRLWSFVLRCKNKKTSREWTCLLGESVSARPTWRERLPSHPVVMMRLARKNGCQHLIVIIRKTRGLSTRAGLGVPTHSESSHAEHKHRHTNNNQRVVRFGARVERREGNGGGFG